MKEIGGYIELDTYKFPMLHEKAVALNCGRNCLAYLFKSRGIKKIKLPYFICNAVFDVCDRESVAKNFYHIGLDFKPTEDLKLEDDEWLYIVNFYGQLSNNEIQRYVDRYKRVIVDQANGYFEMPLAGVDTLYTCRKWFGVSDGAFLYTDKMVEDELPRDESFDRMRFLLGRYERTANEFYSEYNTNNKLFASEPVKKMSKLTNNLLHGIDYKTVESTRKENFEYLHKKLRNINQLDVKPATFMYPLMVENGAEIRKKLQAKKIFIPILWPTVLEITSFEDLEHKMTENILPFPVDQRYGIEDMEYMVQEVLKCINREN